MAGTVKLRTEVDISLQCSKGNAWICIQPRKSRRSRHPDHTHTVCPRGLNPIRVVIYCINWVQTALTYSNTLILWPSPTPDMHYHFICYARKVSWRIGKKEIGHLTYFETKSFRGKNTFGMWSAAMVLLLDGNSNTGAHVRNYPIY